MPSILENGHPNVLTIGAKLDETRGIGEGFDFLRVALAMLVVLNTRSSLSRAITIPLLNTIYGLSLGQRCRCFLPERLPHYGLSPAPKTQGFPVKP